MVELNLLWNQVLEGRCVYTNPANPIKAIAKMPAVISAAGVPFIVGRCWSLVAGRLMLGYLLYIRDHVKPFEASCNGQC